MRLTPRYDEPSFFELDLPLDDPAVPLLRQRRRLASIVSELDDAQWAAATRCEGWSVKDVIAHLVTTSQFFAFTIGAALKGERTRFLASFDPVSTPAELVDATRSQQPSEVLAAFGETNEALAAAVVGIDDEGWSTAGEAPPGHVPLRAVALHALWDAWIHERDIVLPLGIAPVEVPDEIIGSLAYCTALAPAFTVAGGGTRQGAIAVDATDPDVSFVVDVGDSVVVRSSDAPAAALCLSGKAVELIEALSFRAPLPCPVPDDRRWLVAGLAEVFDREV